MTRNMLTIDGRLYDVAQEVYIYVRRLEAYIKHPTTSKLLEHYPHLKPKECPTCQGWGFTRKTADLCPDCEGAGYPLKPAKRKGFLTPDFGKPCPRCAGSGKTNLTSDGICYACNGSGKQKPPSPA